MSNVTYEFKQDTRPYVSPMGYTTYDVGIQKNLPDTPKAQPSISGARILPDNLCSGKEDTQGLKQIAKTQTILLISKWTMDDILQTNMDRAWNGKMNTGMSSSRLGQQFALRQGVSLDYSPFKMGGNYTRKLVAPVTTLKSSEWSVSHYTHG